MDHVCTPDTLNELLNEATPGDTFTIEAGSYADCQVTLAATGSNDQPIAIRATDPGSVVFSGTSSFVVSGTHLVIENLTFDGCALEESCVVLDGAANCRVTSCLFTRSGGRRAAISIQGDAGNNTVDHCEFAHLEQRSVQVVIRGETAPSNNRVIDNVFRDIPRIPSGNGRETIQIGQNQRDWGHVEPKTLVARNQFLRCDGEIEIISNKSSRNDYRNNLFKDCKGELVMRGGSHCVIEGNRHENCTGGIRLSGTHHTVIHNLVRNCVNGLKISYGMTLEQGGLYQAVTGCLVAHNTVIDTEKVGLSVGTNRMMDRKEMGVAKYAPFENRFQNNIFTSDSGEHVRVDQAPDNQMTSNLFAGAAGVGDELPEGNLVVGDAGLNDRGEVTKASPAFGEAMQIELAAAFPHLGTDPERLKDCPG